MRGNRTEKDNQLQYLTGQKKTEEQKLHRTATSFLLEVIKALLLPLCL